MFITPLSSSITPLDILSQNEPVKEASEHHASFADVFREVYNDTVDTQRILNENAADLVMGEIDDLHTIYNNITKAELSLQTFVAIRDAAQTSYKELMQMSL